MKTGGPVSPFLHFEGHGSAFVREGEQAVHRRAALSPGSANGPCLNAMPSFSHRQTKKTFFTQLDDVCAPLQGRRGVSAENAVYT